MKFLLAAAVFVLMVSIGMSLRVPELVTNWRRISWFAWLRLLLATFLIPPAVVLVLARILPLEPSQLVGLFMVGVAPGAPLLTRNIARRGFDMHLAASYQVWGALLTPLMIPLVVAAAGKLYDRDIWISPVLLILQILEKEFVPLLVGMAAVQFAPALSQKLQPAINRLGNVVLTGIMVLLLVKMGPAILGLSVWLPVAALILAVSCVAAIFLLLPADRVRTRTLAISNANRHVGLALLLTGQYTHARNALPAIACYALLVAVLLIVAPKIFRQPQAIATPVS